MGSEKAECITDRVMTVDNDFDKMWTGVNSTQLLFAAESRRYAQLSDVISSARSMEPRAVTRKSQRGTAVVIRKACRFSLWAISYNIPGEDKA